MSRVTINFSCSMKQVLQSLSSGRTFLESVPVPSISPGEILIKTSRTLISAGTEKMLVDFGKSNYIQKALKQRIFPFPIWSQFH